MVRGWFGILLVFGVSASSPSRAIPAPQDTALRVCESDLGLASGYLDSAFSREEPESNSAFLRAGAAVRFDTTSPMSAWRLALPASCKRVLDESRKTSVSVSLQQTLQARIACEYARGKLESVGSAETPIRGSCQYRKVGSTLDDLLNGSLAGKYVFDLVLHVRKHAPGTESVLSEIVTPTVWECLRLSDMLGLVSKRSSFKFTAQCRDAGKPDTSESVLISKINF